MVIRNPSVTIPAERSMDKKRECEKSTLDGTCYDLECIVQPRFFCGQLLTDQDLTTLLNWSQAKFRLSHYHDGWGVVCGLEVRCDPQNLGHVIVEPGYAVDCCGNDIIIYEPVMFDLREACKHEEDPCEQLGRESPVSTEDIRGEKIHVREKPLTDMRSRTDEQGSYTEIVDLYLGYAEKGSQAIASLGRKDCNQTSVCEYTRTHETFQLSWHPTRLAESDTYLVEKWLENYFDCLKVVQLFNRAWKRMKSSDDPRDIGTVLQSWLLDWLKKNPLHQFCGIRDFICDLTANDFMEVSSRVFDILLFMAQDYRNNFLKGFCYDCENDPGVPLARIWLQRIEHECKIFVIESFPPYRRPITVESWPAQPGTVNGGQVIWYRYKDACAILKELGVNVAGKQELAGDKNLDTLEALLRQSPLLPVCTGLPVTLITVQGIDDDRVIAFSTDDDGYGFERPPVGGEKPKPAPKSEDEKDDLTEIRYITKERAEMLADADIVTYSHLAASSVNKLKRIIPQLSERTLTNWLEEAAELAVKGKSRG